MFSIKLSYEHKMDMNALIKKHLLYKGNHKQICCKATFRSFDEEGKEGLIKVREGKRMEGKGRRGS